MCVSGKLLRHNETEHSVTKWKTNLNVYKIDKIKYISFYINRYFFKKRETQGKQCTRPKTVQN